MHTSAYSLLCNDQFALSACSPQVLDAATISGHSPIPVLTAAYSPLCYDPFALSACFSQSVAAATI